MTSVFLIHHTSVAAMAKYDDDPDDTGPERVALTAPRENPLLIGHEAAEATLLASYTSGRLPHAWLFSGPRGIGKATLAFRFARFPFADSARPTHGLFAAAPPTGLDIAADLPVFRRVASGGHPDLLVVERGYDPKRSGCAARSWWPMPDRFRRSCA